MELNYKLVPLILIGITLVSMFLQIFKMIFTDDENYSRTDVIIIKHIYHTTMIISQGVFYKISRN